jgi:hypothetical protein
VTDTVTAHTGGCLCGGVRYRVRGELRGILACHCSQCRRTSGHYAAMTSAPSANIELTAADSLVWYKSSDTADRGFCGRCGGTLDTPTGLAVQEHIFVADKSDYYTIDDGLPMKQRW